MKKIILLAALCMGLAACGNKAPKDKNAAAAENTGDRVEMLYFHGKQRCATCIAIEEGAKAVAADSFGEEIKNGTLVFRIIDLSQPENEAIAEKYEVTWSSLFLCRWKDGKETSENLTEYAFANARTEPETFKAELTRKIRLLLNQ